MTRRTIAAIRCYMYIAIKFCPYYFERRCDKRYCAWNISWILSCKRMFLIIADHKLPQIEMWRKSHIECRIPIRYFIKVARQSMSETIAIPHLFIGAIDSPQIFGEAEAINDFELLRHGPPRFRQPLGRSASRSSPRLPGVLLYQAPIP